MYGHVNVLLALTSLRRMTLHNPKTDITPALFIVRKNGNIYIYMLLLLLLVLLVSILIHALTPFTFLSQSKEK